MIAETKPRVLIVYHTFTNQSSRVAEAIAKELEARGCEVARAMIEFTDQRFVPKLFSQFPLKHPIAQVSSMFTAQLRHKTGGDPHSLGSTSGRLRPRADRGSHLVDPDVHADPLIPSSPAARVILDGKPFATVSISRRYYSINLGQQRKLGEKNGGRFTDQTHFVAAGGQVKSMLSWLGYMKHGEPQERALGLKLPPPNLKPDFEEQAKTFADGLVDRVLQRAAANAGK